MSGELDVLIPTYRRPAALAVLLTSLSCQTYRDFRIVISDQSQVDCSLNGSEARAAIRVLRAGGRSVELHFRTNFYGIAEQRQYLLNQSKAPYVLFLDDDLILEANLIERLMLTVLEEGCGFVGSGPIGLSFIDDIRPLEQKIEWWDNRVEPELVTPSSASWKRHRLHNAANLYHLARRLNCSGRERLRYRVAWIGGCVLYNRSVLEQVGGFGFWSDLPLNHAGEDVLAQLKVMARYGGCGVFPSGVYHQELVTTLPDRTVDAPRYLKA